MLNLDLKIIFFVKFLTQKTFILNKNYFASSTRAKIPAANGADADVPV
jgi:hypothetical protein